MYTQWYSDILLRRVSAGHICFSSTLKSFVSLTAEGAIPFNAEEFSDPTELRALVELIGPYGIRLLNETLMWHIGKFAFKNILICVLHFSMRPILPWRIFCPWPLFA